MNTTSGLANIIEFGDGMTVDNFFQGSIEEARLLNVGPMVITLMETAGPALIAAITIFGSVNPAVSITGTVDIFTSQDDITGSGDFGALVVGGNVSLEGQIKGVGDPGLDPEDNQNTTAASVINVLGGGACTFNGAICLDNPAAVGAAAALSDFVGGPFIPQPPPSDTATNSLENTPAQCAFNSDPLEGASCVDVFGTEFELVEAAGGADAAYTGLNYVFQDFWEFLEEGEGGEATPDTE